MGIKGCPKTSWTLRILSGTLLFFLTGCRIKIRAKIRILEI